MLVFAGEMEVVGHTTYAQTTFGANQKRAAVKFAPWAREERRKSIVSYLQLTR